MSIEKIMTDIKTAWGVAIGTAGSGVSTVLDAIPNDIGKLATVIGIVLSCVLIFVHIKRWMMDARSRELNDKLTEIRIANELRRAEDYSSTPSAADLTDRTKSSSAES